MTRPLPSLLIGVALVAVLVAVPPAAGDSSKDTVIDDHGTPTDPGPVFAGHPASVTGACPYVDAGWGLPDGGCMKEYTFNVPGISDESNTVEIKVDYDADVIRTEPTCMKGADLDLFLYNADGEELRASTGCDSRRLGVDGYDLPSGNYIVEVRGNWGAVVEYRVTGTMTHH